MPKRLLIGLGITAAVLLVAVGVGLFLFFGGDEPEGPSVDNALANVTTTTTATGETAAPAAGIEGTWNVDTEIGEFDFESATGTFAGFRIAEELDFIGQTEAVGRTGDVSGSMTIEGTTVTDAIFEVDLTTITSDQQRRERPIQEALETDRFPTATFELTEPIELGPDAANGTEVQVVATGDLTIHGVTKSVDFPLTARLQNGVIGVEGALDITFADFDVEVPTARVVLSVDDHGPIELQLLLSR